MAQHTPTPWKLVDVKDGGGDQSYRVTTSENSPEGFGYGVGCGDNFDSAVFHDQHYYPMAPNKNDAAFIVKSG